MRKLLKSNQDGFTLVELMVVVAIIGILSAIAVPNFKKYQAKSKTSEAKLQLSASYTAEQSFFSDFDAYAQCLAFMGFNPVNEVNQRYYAVGFASDNTVPTAAHIAILTTNGATGCDNTNLAGSSIFAGGKQTGSTAAVTTFAQADLGATGNTSVTEDNFVIAAAGIVDKLYTTGMGTPATAYSIFTITDQKRILQISPGY